MIAYKNLLCPIDFSGISKHALQIAIDLAERFEANLLVVHVFQLPASSFPDGVIDTPSDLESTLEKQLSIKLDEFIKDMNNQECVITTAIFEGITHDEINRAAEKYNADMIVMGTHGRTGISQVLLGSVAERVVRTSTVPVLTVRK